MQNLSSREPAGQHRHGAAGLRALQPGAEVGVPRAHVGVQPMEGEIVNLILPWPSKELSPNARMHHMALHRAKKAYREACAWQAKAQGARAMAVARLHVTFTFYPPSKRRIDLDNCIARMKSGIDGLADVLGVDDSRWKMSFALADEIGGMVRVHVEAVQ